MAEEEEEKYDKRSKKDIHKHIHTYIQLDKRDVKCNKLNLRSVKLCRNKLSWQ